MDWTMSVRDYDLSGDEPTMANRLVSTAEVVSGIVTALNSMTILQSIGQ